MASRFRSWMMIGYPGDSLPDNYREILGDELHLSWAESPQHNADLNGDDTEKKNHIHFYIYFEGPKSFEQVNEIAKRLKCPIPKVCDSVRGYIRYFVHLDNPEKAQYDRKDIFTHGIDVDSYFDKSRAETRRVLSDLVDFIEDNNILSFSDFTVAVFASGDPDWIDIITCRNTMFFSSYLRDRRYHYDRF